MAQKPMDQKSIQRLSNLNFNTWRIVFFITLLFFTYFPVFIIEFGIHNDYSAWDYDNSNCCLGYPESTHLLAVGRPLGALLLNIQFLFFDSVSDFAPARFLSFGFILASAGLMHYYLTKRLLLAQGWALALVFCIFTLPSSQLYIIWVTNFIPGSFNVFLACLSYLIMDTVWRNRSLPQKTVANIVGIITASLIFTISLFIYPPTALFFLVFTFANVLFSKISLWATTRLRVAIDVLFCSFYMAVYFILIRFVYFPLLSYYDSDFGAYLASINKSYEFSITSDFSSKIQLLFLITRTALNGWNTKVDNDFSTEVFLLLLAMGVVLTFFHFFTFQTSLNKSQPLRQKFSLVLQGVAACSLLLILSISSLLISAGGFVAYRTIFPYSAMAILILFWLFYKVTQAISEKKRKAVVNSLLIVITIIAAIVTQTNLLNTALGAHTELNFIRHSLATVDFSRVNRLIFVKPFGDGVFTDKNSNHEFSYMATNLAFVGGIVRVALSELHVDQSSLRITPIDPDSKQKLYIDKKMSHIINMNNARTFDTTQAKSSSIVYVEASHVSGCCPLQHAFDKNNHTFWEYDKHLPVWLEIDYGDNPTSVTRYSLRTHILPERMPRSWELLASEHGDSWIVLDRRENQVEWNIFESRTFLIQASRQFRYYRIVFQEGISPITLRIGDISFFKDQDYQLVEEGYEGFDLVSYNGQIYGFSQSLGAIDLTAIDPSTLDRYQNRGEVIVGDTVAEVKSKLR